MTNEELAMQAKAGSLQAAGELWEQNRGLFHVILNQLMHNPGIADRMQPAGVTAEDAFQCTYFAVLAAVRAFDPARGYRFAAYLKHPLRNELFDLIGFRIKRDLLDPVNSARSLSMPMGEDESLTLADIVPDEQAETAFLTAEERVYRQQLRQMLDGCLSQMEGKQAEVIRLRYYEGCTQRETACRLGVCHSRIGQLESAAMKRMRRDRNIRRWHEQVVQTSAYHGTGFRAWKDSGGSVQERTVEKLERLQLL